MQSYTKVRYKSRGIPVGSVVICERCCKRPGNDIHHADGRRGTLLNDPNNLICVCRQCHNYLEAHDTSRTIESVKSRIAHRIKFSQEVMKIQNRLEIQ